LVPATGRAAAGRGNRVNLGITIALLLGALEQTLLRLAKFHGNRAGPWLDEIERQFERDLKSGYFLSGPVHLEPKIADDAIALLQVAFINVRRQLDDPPKGD
jgi:hypothetical protein